MQDISKVFVNLSVENCQIYSFKVLGMALQLKGKDW